VTIPHSICKGIQNRFQTLVRLSTFPAPLGKTRSSGPFGQSRIHNSSRPAISSRIHRPSGHAAMDWCYDNLVGTPPAGIVFSEWARADVSKLWPSWASAVEFLIICYISAACCGVTLAAGHLDFRSDLVATVCLLLSLSCCSAVNLLSLEHAGLS
jgi:hypothetical protein